jgi:hypothetical protein
MAYAGRQPTTGFRSTPTKDSFNGDNSTVAFTLSIPTRTNDVEVFVENVQQEPVTAYSISGTTLTFTSAPPTGTGNIYVIHRAELVSNGVHTPGANLDAGVTTLDSLTVAGDIKTEVASGGIYTITGTDTSSNRTLTLPDEAGTIATTNGITGTDQWRVTSEITTAGIIDSNIERNDESSFGKIGSGMSVSSGVWTFPTTGLWSVSVDARLSIASGDVNVGVITYASINGGSTWDLSARASQGNSGTATITGGGSSQIFVNVTDTSQVKVKFHANSVASGSDIGGSTDENRTSFTFIRLGDSV